jgi:NAD-dependent dihydropyrimidine dehydrogenase PreA subunit
MNEKSWVKPDAIEPTIDETKCIFCMNCFEACPQEVYDIDYENKKMLIVNPNECLVCLHCEEACPTNAVFIKGAIRIKWKIPPRESMWGTVAIKPPE